MTREWDYQKLMHSLGLEPVDVETVVFRCTDGRCVRCRKKRDSAKEVEDVGIVGENSEGDSRSGGDVVE